MALFQRKFTAIQLLIDGYSFEPCFNEILKYGLNRVREKLAPWLSAVYCSILAVIVTIANLWAYSNGGSDNAATIVFILFMPMCFFFEGAYLTQLRKENRDLRLRIDEMQEDISTP